MDESSIRVAVRIRPQGPREVLDLCRTCTRVAPDEPQIWLGNEKSFTYDYVFDTATQQTQVFNDCLKNLLDGCFDGYNATVLAYGQTGSGKTHTMGTGFGLSVNENQIGIIPRSVRYIFEGIAERRRVALQNEEAPPEFKVNCQFMELYNEEIIDLFHPSARDGRPKRSTIKIHEDGNGHIYTVGVTARIVNSEAETLGCLKEGALARTTASTDMNAQSSRSHAIFTLHIKQSRLVKEKADDEECDGEEGVNELETLTAKFHFVDLAGSERLKRTGATGDRAKESISINSGLLSLGNVISALGDKSKKVSHVPYRDSKLTRLLQDSLGGNSQTLMIACISPSDRDFMETLNTLRYANRARNITNKITINQDKSSKTISLLRSEIQALQLELNEYKQGKRQVIDGVETESDAFQENSMLLSENNSMRVRIKAMQETIDSLTKRNFHLLAEKEAGHFINSDDQKSEINDVIKNYIEEAEKLRGKLIESEHLNEILRKQNNAIRAPSRLSTSPTRRMSVAVAGMYEIGSDSEATPLALINTAKQDVEEHQKKLERTRRRTMRHKRKVRSDDVNQPIEEEDEQAESVEPIREDNETGDSNSDDGDDGGKEEGDESDDSSSDTEAETAPVYNELADLTTEISIKQKLIEELERSQQKQVAMKQHYEMQLKQLEVRMKEVQTQRDVALNAYNQAPNPKDGKALKAIKDDYEKKINHLEKEIKKMNGAMKMHAKVLKSQGQSEKQLHQLRNELQDMKKTKVKLMQKIRDDNKAHLSVEQRNAKQLAQLRKQERIQNNKIKTLEADKRLRDNVLKRKQEECMALKRQTKAGMSSKVAGRVPSRPQNLAIRHIQSDTMILSDSAMSPKAAKNKWQLLEKHIAKQAHDKHCSAVYERDMDILMVKREVQGKELEAEIMKRDAAILNSVSENEVKIIEDQIDSYKSCIAYVTQEIESIQQQLVAVDDNQDDSPFGLLPDLSAVNLTEAHYLLDKLFALAVAERFKASQAYATAVQKDGQLNRTKEELDLANKTVAEQDVFIHSILMDQYADQLNVFAADEPNSNSTSPTDSTNDIVDLKTPYIQQHSFQLPVVKSGKIRRRSATPKELLYPSENDARVTIPTAITEDIPAIEEHIDELFDLEAQESNQTLSFPLTPAQEQRAMKEASFVDKFKTCYGIPISSPYRLSSFQLNFAGGHNTD